MTAWVSTLVLLALAYLSLPTAASAETIYACKVITQGTIRIVTATTNAAQRNEDLLEHRRSDRPGWSARTGGSPGPAGGLALRGPQAPLARRSRGSVSPLCANQVATVGRRRRRHGDWTARPGSCGSRRPMS